MTTKRSFLPSNFTLETWDSIKEFLDNLCNREINSAEDLLNWWKNRSEIESFLEEDLAWRYIKMNCDTTNKDLQENFNFFITQIEPKLSEYGDVLDRKLIESQFLKDLDSEKYKIPIRSIKRKIELFRMQNIPIIAELQQEEQEYGVLSAAMTINYDNQEMTLQKAANYLKNTDRNVRKTVFELIQNRRLLDSEKLNELFEKLLKKRNLIALNTDFKNFTDFKFADLKRFDYTIKDCEDFHESTKSTVIPITAELNKSRKIKLKLDVLKPYDTEVDEDLKPPIIAFSDAKDLIEKSIEVFKKVRPKYAQFLQTMQDNGYLDLDSRIGKAPGGFNYPLYESNIPFIFTNATGNLRDVETLMHEGGHAIHSFLSSDLELVDFKGLSSEIAELASMSMELISMEHWDAFFQNHDDLIRAKKHQLEGVIKTLPWIALVDKFQHFIYNNPNHTTQERTDYWVKISNEFGSNEVDWTGYENSFENLWQRQLHIFEVPFYYIEYGFAQLGAIAIWKNYKENPEKALNNYENALKLGYTKTIPEIYKAAGIEFNFSTKYIGELMNFVKSELEKLK